MAAVTLGCKVNAYDTESVLARFREAGYEVKDWEDKAAVYIVNTCSVTAVSDKKSRQMIRRAASKGGIVVVTGCYAQNKAEEARNIPGVHIVTGVKERGEIVRLVENYHDNYSGANGIINLVTGYNRDKLLFENMPVKGLTGRTRAFVKIQDGCENFCSYCVIPHIRGPVRSRLLDDVADEIKAVAAAGVKEVVLTGISVASYGQDLPDLSLPAVIRAAANAAGIERVRVSSIGPGAVTPGFLGALREFPALCGHVHLSLQAGCDRTLARMNRKYTTDEYMGAVQAIRSIRPDASITTDVITGFPGETESDFEESLAFARHIRFAQLHVFPFSRREGTAAADMPDQIPKKIKEERAARMIELGNRLKSDFTARNLGTAAPVLFESRLKSGAYTGLTPNYIEVSADSETDIRGKILPVCLKTVENGQVYGILC